MKKPHLWRVRHEGLDASVRSLRWNYPEQVRGVPGRTRFSGDLPPRRRFGVYTLELAGERVGRRNGGLADVALADIGRRAAAQGSALGEERDASDGGALRCARHNAIGPIASEHF